jgi:tRNA (guanine37-N1)-methyltransferase
MMFEVLTLFPEMFESVLNTSILGRAKESGLLSFKMHNIRDYAKNKHRQVDDYPYGGGSGMVMTPQPLFDLFNHILGECPKCPPKIIYFTPQGRLLTQSIAKEYAKESHLLLLCGHYEGIDQRVLDTFVDDEISIGDYVLTGGELPAMVFIDCVSRFVDGVLGNSESLDEESFSQGLLEYPQYTRPQIYKNLKFPDVLLSGNHKNIEEWKTRESLRNTFLKRPDLLNKVKLTDIQNKILTELNIEEKKSRNNK